ncbi:J domain-containing protein [Kribbella sp. NPDC051586]|uniref:J domain-containing protein n=1 Tax=Kribbella sp. NPDC051586 TaxID=3364118 RepID=UPI0037B8DDEE
MKSSGQTDLYKVLEVAADADAHQLDQAFRTLARRYHPDAQDQEEPAQPDSQHFQEVLAAYAVLRDPVARAAYDKAKRHAVHAAPAGHVGADSAGPMMDSSAMPSFGPEPPLRVGPVHWTPHRAQGVAGVQGL